LHAKVTNSSAAFRLLPTYVHCLRTAQRYFDPEETEKILNELVPKINLLKPFEAMNYLALLAQLLPTARPPPVPKYLDNCTHSYYWVPAVFQIWESIAWSSEANGYFCELMATLAYDQYSTPLNVPWKQKYFRKIFSVAINSFGTIVGFAEPIDVNKLPLVFGTKYSISTSGYLTYTSMWAGIFETPVFNSIAIFAVYTLYPQSFEKEIITLECLFDLCQLVDPFCHPSNHGPWTGKILQFFNAFCSTLLNRRNLEQRGEFNTPEAYKITSEMCIKISRKIFPLVQKASFCESLQDSQLAHSIIRLLCQFDKEYILPILLPDVDSSLCNLVQSQRTYSSLNLLAKIIGATSTSHFKNEIPGLMLKSLPGLDLNDEEKANSTAYLFTCLSYHITLVDQCSYGTVENNFKQWIEIFLDKIFYLFSRLPEKQIISGDQSIARTITSLTKSIFLQISNELEIIALNYLAKNITNVLPFAMEHIVGIYSAFSARNPTNRLDAFLPICTMKIKSELSLGLGQSYGESDSLPYGMYSISDSELHWYQWILAEICCESGASLLKYETELFDVLNLMVKHCNSKLSYTLAFNLFYYTTHSLVAIYPQNSSSQNLNYWNDLEKLQESQKWGGNFDKESLVIEWHVPNRDEKRFGLNLLSHFIAIALQELRDLVDGRCRRENTVFLQLQKWLELLLNCVTLTHYILCPKARAENTGLFSNSGISFTPQLSYPWLVHVLDERHYTEWDQKITELREALNLVVDFLKLEGNTEPNTCIIVIDVINLWLGQRYNSSAIEAKIKDCRAATEITGDHSSIPRFARVQQVYLLHLKRLQLIKRNAEFDETLTKHLISYAFSRLETVRMHAQRVLENIFSCSRRTFELYFAHAIAILQNPEALDYELKGVLEFFLDSKLACAILQRHWEFFLKFSVTLVKLRSTGNLNDDIVELVESLLDHLHQIIIVTNRNLNANARCEYLCKDIQVNLAELDGLRKMAIKHREEFDVSLKQYVLELLNLVSSDNHWSIDRHVANFLALSMTSDVPVLKRVVDFGFQGCLDKNPMVRYSCTTLLIECFNCIKRRSKISGNCYSVPLKEFLTFGEKKYFDLVNASFDRTSNSAILPNYLDASMIGWFCFPNRLKTYQSGLTGAEFFDEFSFDAIKLIESYLSNNDWWAAFIDNLSLEDESLEFDIEVSIFVGVLGSFGSEIFHQIVVTKIYELLDTSEPVSHRVASQLLLGLFLGSRHRSHSSRFEKFQRLASKILHSISDKDLKCSEPWMECFNNLFSIYDRRRFGYFFEESLNCIDGNFRFPNVRLFLSMFSAVLFDMETNESVLELFLKQMEKPFQESRYALGSGINCCLQQLSRPVERVNCTLENFLKRCYSENFKFKPAHQPYIKILESSQEMRVEIVKTLYSTLQHSLTDFNRGSFVPYHGYYLKFLITQIAKIGDSDLSPVLHEMSKQFGSYLMPEENVQETLHMLMEACINNLDFQDLPLHFKSVSRICVMLETFYHNHILFIPTSDRAAVVNVCLNLCQSPFIEIRDQTIRTLARVLKCTYPHEIVHIAVNVDLC
jgi:hypothetical protein